MRKRSSYRPHPQLENPLQWVLNGFAPIHQSSQAVSLKIKNHSAMLDMTQGRGSRSAFDLLVAALNMAEGLSIVNPEKLGGHLEGEIRASQNALHSMGKRSVSKGVFCFTGSELQAMNIGMDIHDQQLDACNIAELDASLRLVVKTIREKKARAIA